MEHNLPWRIGTLRSLRAREDSLEMSKTNRASIMEFFTQDVTLYSGEGPALPRNAALHKYGKIV
jgi:hypothetical protein